jgi:hypothetical protein
MGWRVLSAQGKATATTEVIDNAIAEIYVPNVNGITDVR